MINENELKDVAVEPSIKTYEQMQAEKMLNSAIPDSMDDDLNAPYLESEPEKPRADAVQSLQGMLSIVPIAFNHLEYKRAAAVWSDDKCASLSGALVPVFRKYPWGLKIVDFLETGAGVEEVALCMVAWPVAQSTYLAIKADKADIDAKIEAQNQADYEPQVYGTNRP
jgi:hypothetical protein